MEVERKKARKGIVANPQRRHDMMPISSVVDRWKRKDFFFGHGAQRGSQRAEMNQR